MQRRRGGSTLPVELQSGVEQLSGLSMDDVRVHYDSSRPTRIEARAYTHGQDIEIASGQEHHLAHEAWHVVQQMQGRVHATGRLKGVPLNRDERLEREADVMGGRASALGAASASDHRSTRIVRSTAPMVTQRVRDLLPKQQVKVRIKAPEGGLSGWDEYPAVIDSVSSDGNKYRVTYEDKELNQPGYEIYYPRELEEQYVTPGKVIPMLREAADDKKASAPWADPALKLDADSLDKLWKIAAKSRTIKELSEAKLEKMIALLTSLEDQTRERLDLIKALDKPLTKIRETAEPEEQVLKRAGKISTEIEKAQNEAFQEQFGINIDIAKWDDVHAAVLDWYAQVKAAEGKADDPLLDPFHVPFEANRMTGRQINLKPDKRGARWEVDRYDPEKSKGPAREMYLDKTVAGVEKRQNYANFRTRETKNKEGLHDLSASLLSKSKGDIFGQLKPYGEAVVLFMPLPAEKDLRILSSLARIAGIPKHWAEVFEDLITHPKFAQASDMGATFTDTETGEGAQGTFEYGVTGTVIRKSGDFARNINAADLADRRRGALFYTEVAKSTITKVNEIVMAYRQHSSKRFPMYAKWEQQGDKKGVGRFIEVKSDMTPTDMAITNAGRYVKA